MICTILFRHISKRISYSNQHIVQIKKISNMNQVLLFTLNILLSLQTTSPHTLGMPQIFLIEKGSCRTLRFEYSSLPQNASLTFSFWNRSVRTVKPTVFKLHNTYQFSSNQTQICSINNILDKNKTFINYYITNENKNYSYSNNGNHTLIVYIFQSKNQRYLNDVVWKNQNKTGNYADFTVETPGNRGTLYFSISGLPEQNSSTVPDNLNSCRTFEEECLVGGIYNLYVIYYNLTQRRYPRENLMYGKQISNFKTQISFNYDLIEATTYQICSFYRDSQSYKQSNISCFNFSTDSSQSFISVRFKFTSRISFIKLNIFLCFLVSHLGTHMRDIITIDGYSCYINLNSEIQVTNYFYPSLAKTIRFKNQTILYIYQQEKNSHLRYIYEQIWNFSQDLSSNFSNLLKQCNITWIESGKKLGVKPISTLLNTSKSIGLIYQATKIIQDAGQEQKNVTLNFSIISFQEVGAANFVIVIFYGGIERQQFYTEDNILQCSNDHSSQSGVIFTYCYKIILTSIPEKPFYYDVNFTMPSKAVFKVLYYETNEYPKFPIVVKKFSEVQFKGEQKEFQKREQKHEQKDEQKQQENKTDTEKQAKVQQPKVKEKGTVFLISAFYLSINLALAYL